MVLSKLAKLVQDRKDHQRKERKKLKAKGLPTSKAALWRYLEKHGNEDKGYGSVDYKEGKYGKFVPSYGEPDGTLYFDSQEVAEIASKKL
jgi:hypothetical protein